MAIFVFALPHVLKCDTIVYYSTQSGLQDRLDISWNSVSVTRTPIDHLEMISGVWINHVQATDVNQNLV